MSPWRLHQTIDGGGIGIIVESQCKGFRRGEILESFHWPWQMYAFMELRGVNCLLVKKVEINTFFILFILYLLIVQCKNVDLLGMCI